MGSLKTLYHRLEKWVGGANGDNVSRVDLNNNFDSIDAKFGDFSKLPTTEKTNLAGSIKEHIESPTAHNATSAAMASRIMSRDANGRAKIAAPLEQDDIARKHEVDVVNQRISEIVTNPASGVTAQEIIDARKGKESLREKIDEMDANFDTHMADISYGAKFNGLKGDNATDDSVKFLELITKIGGEECSIFFPRGVYRIGSNITIPSNIHLEFDRGAMLSLDAGVTLTINGTVKAGKYQIFSGDGSIAGLTTLFPEWFGAKGDMVTDDTVALTKCFTSAPARSTVYLTRYYKHTGLSIVKTNFTIKGVGNNTSVLYYSGTTGIGVEFGSSAGTTYNLKVEDVGFVNDTEGTTAVIVQFTKCQYVWLNNIKVGGNDKGYIGMHMSACVGVFLDGMLIEALLNNGLQITGGGSDQNYKNVIVNPGQTVAGNALHIVNMTSGSINFNNFSTLKGNKSLYIANSRYCKFTQCYFDSSAVGVDITSGSKLIKFLNSWFSNRPGNGIVINSAQGVTFSVCDIVNCGLSGLVLQQSASDIHIKDCNIHGNNTQNDASGNGITVAAGCSKFYIQGNTIDNDIFTGHQKRGIMINTGASDNYIVSQNSISGMETADIFDGGTGVNKVVANNL